MYLHFECAMYILGSPVLNNKSFLRMESSNPEPESLAEILWPISNSSDKDDNLQLQCCTGAHLSSFILPNHSTQSLNHTAETKPFGKASTLKTRP